MNHSENLWYVALFFFTSTIAVSALGLIVGFVIGAVREFVRRRQDRNQQE